jgi:3-methyl-2-oxobutanoate hydroxymethyltransferase
MLGFFEEFKPKFVRHYLNGATLVKNAIKHYVDDVKKGLFPDENEKY